MTPLVERALQIAESYVGIREKGQNRGPEIDEWIKVLGLPPGSPYCVAFLVVGCFRRAALELGIPSPIPRTGKAARLWQRSPEWALTQRPTRGSIFIRLKEPRNPESKGHAGLVRDVLWHEDRMLTVEANTGRDTAIDDPADREGDGVHKRSRAIRYANVGFIDFSLPQPEPVA